MDATTRGIFGEGARGELARDGEYGESPEGFRMPGSMSLGPVHLAVGDLDRSVHYYEAVLGLRLVERTDARATLAAQADVHPLIVLHEQRGVASVDGGGRLGLYHFAILLPDRPSLGRFVRHLRTLGVRAGAGDHLVSEAFYLTDPDGLGIEVYADRPRESWRRAGRELMMATDPVDVADLVSSAGETPWSGMPIGTRMGHVHLHVGDITSASAFYHDALGLDRTVWSYPGALFLSAGGYHHHLGTNTWAGPGATPASATDARLLEWTIELPAGETLVDVARSLTDAGHAVESENGELLARDPWGTAVRIRVGFDPLRHAVPRAVTS